VLTLVLRDGLRLAAYGMVTGAVVAIGGVYLLGHVFQAVASGPAPFIYSTAIVSILALMASLVPALRAAVKSPLAVLRDGS
jgi:ABC-type antimicrobial peptide transport system permease subunit